MAGLSAKLELIGADTITDDKGNSFYLIQVRTDKNHLGGDVKPLLIIPGMVATVDIITGEKKCVGLSAETGVESADRGDAGAVVWLGILW